MANDNVRHIPIKCDCCGREQLATIVDDGAGLKISIYTRRHGKIHYFAEKIDALINSCGVNPKGETDGAKEA